MVVILVVDVKSGPPKHLKNDPKNAFKNDQKVTFGHQGP